MKIQITDTNYFYYKKVFEIIGSHFFKLYPGMPANANPLVILNEWEAKNKTVAKKGIKSGLQDLISQIKEFPPELRKAIDRDLEANSLPRLAELSGGIDKIISNVLKRKKIKTPEEFYIIKEKVIDATSSLSKSDRQLLDKCLADFEFPKSKSNGG